jgi:hypothetical protein
MPVRSGGAAVRMLIRDGTQTGALHQVFSNSTPRAASASMLGVATGAQEPP